MTAVRIAGPKRNGWSVHKWSAGRQSCGLPHRTRLGAWFELRFGSMEGYDFAEIVDHDAEMRRWGYDLGLIEPTDQERAGLPDWHKNYRALNGVEQ